MESTDQQIASAGADRMRLRIDFIGEQLEVEPGHGLTFGRAGDLCIDEHNLHLHRVLGEFRHHEGSWWLHNVGEWTTIEVASVTGSHHDLPPNARLVLVAGGEVSFTAGRTRYGFGFDVDLSAGPQNTRVVPDSPATARFGVIELNLEQRQLLAAMCLHRLADDAGHVNSLPSNKSIAHQLGWKLTKFNRKLDYLCTKLAGVGVGGLHGANGAAAHDRRERLVEHVLATKMITDLDLELLESTP